MALREGGHDVGMIAWVTVYRPWLFLEGEERFQLMDDDSQTDAMINHYPDTS